MSGKTCARCGKVVYPIEELKCLDKIWHKQCFKCQVCQMTLNMRNYKGFNKEPYCEAHIPKAKATTVAETPEYRRIAENTKIQSNVKYHADFERAKGKFTQVADDPETLRIKENSKNISNVAYHGDLQKKADMEKQRDISDRRDGGSYEANNDGYQAQNYSHPQQPTAQQQHSRNLQHSQHQQQQQQQQHHAQDHIPSSVHHSRMPSNVIYTSDRGAVNEAPDRRVGSIHDLDPVNNMYGSLSNDRPGPYSQPQYQPPPQRFYPPPQEPAHPQYTAPPHDTTGSRRDGGYAMNGRVSSSSMPRGYQEPDTSHTTQQPRNSGRVFRAMYEYNAQDTDEVSFLEGDFIVNCTPIDEGWLSGVVQRTGKKGMLPANYVSPAI